jgi:hypothetical protein
LTALDSIEHRLEVKLRGWGKLVSNFHSERHGRVGTHQRLEIWIIAFDS